VLSKSIADELYSLMKEPPSPEVWKRFCRFLKARKWTTCWEWQGAKKDPRRGYGAFRHDGRMRRTHRLICDWLYGKLPEHLVVDHVVCDNEICCNPIHLIPTTNYKNWERSKAPSALNAKKTHCKYGHSLTEDNLVQANKKFGQRRCRECHKRVVKDYDTYRRKPRDWSKDTERRRLKRQVAREA